MSTLQLSTDRLKLWPCTPDDVDALWALWREPLVRRHLWDDREISRRDAEEVVRQFLQAARDRGLGLWMLEAPTGAQTVGFAALREITPGGEVELFYGLAPEFWGQGFATEASRALLRYGFDVLKLPRIWARADPPNVASMRVAERLGMKRAEDPGAMTSYVALVIERESWPG
jgi:RimJ/RimL family protein N-acetyltransferase